MVIADAPYNGFFAFAQELGLLPRNASATAKLDFWVRQVGALQQYYSSCSGEFQPRPIDSASAKNC